MNKKTFCYNRINTIGILLFILIILFVIAFYIFNGAYKGIVDDFSSNIFLFVIDIFAISIVFSLLGLLFYSLTYFGYRKIVIEKEFVMFKTFLFKKKIELEKVAVVKKDKIMEGYLKGWRSLYSDCILIIPLKHKSKKQKYTAIPYSVIFKGSMMEMKNNVKCIIDLIDKIDAINPGCVEKNIKIDLIRLEKEYKKYY